jgi:hypothetical protein
MATVGRNEPCPCGSGKKYKKCCMAKDTSIDLQAFREARAEEGLRSEILKFATGARFKDEMTDAFTIYNQGSIEKALLKQDPLENIRFLDWFIHEHVLSKEDKHMLELFGELRGKHLDEDQKKLLEEWKRSWLGAFEVESVEGPEVKLNDIFANQEHLIEDESTSEEVKPGEVIVTRMTSSWGKKKFGGAPIILAPEAKQKLLDAINAAFAEYQKEHPEADISEYLKTNAHVLSATAADLAVPTIT